MRIVRRVLRDMDFHARMIIAGHIFESGACHCEYRWLGIRTP